MAEGGAHPSRYTYVPIPDLASLEDGKLSMLSAHGLGYGIDMTNENPWTNCGPLKAREIKQLSDVKQKVEAGAFKHYRHEIKSGHSISLSINTTLAAVDYIKMGVDAKTSSSAHYSRNVVGSQVHTRTIDFEIDKCTNPTRTAFEELLLEKLEAESIDVNSDVEKVRKICKNVVEAYRCTHYIRAIKLGAVEYEVLTVDEFQRIYSIKGSIDVKEEHAGGGMSGGFDRIVEKRRKKQKYTKIGEWAVENGQYRVVEERVIEVEITPIHKLVKTSELREALKEAVQEYKKEKLQEGPIGPYLIKCQAETKCYYWRESDSGNKRITVTQDKESATKFSICLENANHQNEFEIQKFQKGVPAERLGCDVTFSGCSPENSPPALKQNFSKSSEHRFCLKDPNKKKGDKASPRDWVSGDEWFFIRCARREYTPNGKGKLCIHLNEDGQELTVVPSTKLHNARDVLMLFCTEKASRESFEYV